MLLLLVEMFTSRSDRDELLPNFGLASVKAILDLGHESYNYEKKELQKAIILSSMEMMKVMVVC